MPHITTLPAGTPESTRSFDRKECRRKAADQAERCLGETNRGAVRRPIPMDVFLYNSGVWPIPPVPLLPETRARMLAAANTPERVEARLTMETRKRQMVEDRRAEALELMNDITLAKTSEICTGLKWSKGKVHIVMAELVKEGLVRINGSGSRQMWELV